MIRCSYILLLVSCKIEFNPHRFYNAVSIFLHKAKIYMKFEISGDLLCNVE